MFRHRLARIGGNKESAFDSPDFTDVDMALKHLETEMTADLDSIYENDREASQHRMAIERISSATGKSFRDIQSL